LEGYVKEVLDLRVGVTSCGSCKEDFKMLNVSLPLSLDMIYRSWKTSGSCKMAFGLKLPLMVTNWSISFTILEIHAAIFSSGASAITTHFK
jgi:hypothetical protein